MIVDLKNKQWFLFSLFPLFFWCVLLTYFNYFYLIMATIGAIITGYNLALDDWQRGMNQIKNQNIVEFDRRFNNTMNKPILRIWAFLLYPYGLVSFFYFNYFVMSYFSWIPYYMWILFFLTWATILYVIFSMMFIPEYWNATKQGFFHGYFTADPKDARIYWVGFGAGVAVRKNYEKAIQCFDRALEHDPTYIPAYGFKGEILMEMKKYEDALNTFNLAIKIDSKNAQIWYHKGLALRYLTRYNEAIKCFEKAIELKHDYAKAWGNLGFTLEAIERYEKAIECFDKALEIDPNKAVTWLLRGRCLSKMGDYRQAIENFDKAIEINPRYLDAWGNRGAAFDLLKRWDDAIKSYDKALEIDPLNSQSWYNRGITFAKLGKFKDALQSVEKSLEINPDNKEAQKICQDLMDELKKK
jgi:tetratricopeptide (TPR) repeat protein